MKFNSSQIKVITVIALAIVAVCAGIVVEALQAKKADGLAMANPEDKPGATVSLDPNLAAEAHFGSEYDEQIVDAIPYQNSLYIFLNASDTGSLMMLSDKCELLGQIYFAGKINRVELCEGGFIMALESADGERVTAIDFSGGTLWESQSYKNQHIEGLLSYEDGQAAVFRSSGELENNLIFRFYKSGEIYFERFISSTYQMSFLRSYRIGDTFVLIFNYGSQYTSGGGAALITPNTVSTVIKYVEISYNYELLDVIPFDGGYAFLTSGVKGSYIQLLSGDFVRSDFIKLSDSPATSGRLSFDGKSYYAFLGGTNKGEMSCFDSQLKSREILPAYAQAENILCEINHGGSLIHLCSADGGAMITSGKGLYSKRLALSGATPNKLVLLGGTTMLVGSGELSGSTLSSYGKSDIYLAILN